MKNVEVLLRENVDALGMCGDVVRVAPGYARNYLVPYGKAVQATPENKKLMDRRRVRLEAEAVIKNAEMDAWIATLSALTLTTRERADEAGRLYGSVSATSIVALLAEKGHAVEERNVRIDAPIKQVGEHKVKVHVYGDKEAEMTVNVVAAAS
jgi:large subunit ribosomal protein L9